MLINIIANAVKFTLEGSVIINISGSDKITVEVIDTGIGMSEEVLVRIFERFEQADKSTTRKYGGTGLGLNIAFNLAKMMGGNIDVKSQLGEGSFFIIHLPLVRTNREKIPKERETLNTPELSDITALLAEDSAINRKIFNKLMSPTNVNILQAKNGTECIELFNIHHPDVIFMDIQMPIMDGVEACKIIRGSSNIPIIAITANVMDEDVKLYKEIGFDCILSKPVELRELYESCVKHIK
jgi:CheY-like chemotaxis protein